MSRAAVGGLALAVAAAASRAALGGPLFWFVLPLVARAVGGSLGFATAPAARAAIGGPALARAAAAAREAVGVEGCPDAGEVTRTAFNIEGRTTVDLEGCAAVGGPLWFACAPRFAVVEEPFLSRAMSPCPAAASLLIGAATESSLVDAAGASCHQKDNKLASPIQFCTPTIASLLNNISLRGTLTLGLGRAELDMVRLTSLLRA